MEWIYIITKVSGEGTCSLEFAQENRKKERMRNGYFLTSGSDMYNCFDEWSWVLLDAQFAGDSDFQT